MEGLKSPLRSPARSPARSPSVSPSVRSPNLSPGRPSSRASSYGSPPHARHRSASIPVTPEALSGVRSRFLTAPTPSSVGRRSAPELLTVDGPLSPAGSSERLLLARRSSETPRRRRHSRCTARPRGNSVPCRSPASPRPSLPLDEQYMLRQFCLTAKGSVVNKGDLYRERSRSNTSVASGASSCSSGPLPPKKVLVMGASGVGKTSLVTQFMSSEYMNAYDGSVEEDAEKNVCVLLDGEEHEISFIDPSSGPDSPGEDETGVDADAYVVVYSITDRGSFEKAVDALYRLRGCDKAVILVGNKSDLVRTRAISPDEAKAVACSYGCKFTETSAAINHQVDELLVGVVTQMRLKAQQRPFRKRMSLGGSGRRILGKLLGKGKVKSQSCGNLYVL